jgi:uncharacterized protein YjdB
MKKSHLLLVMIPVAALFFFGCFFDLSTDGNGNIPVTGIALDSTALHLVAGGSTSRLAVALSPNNATNNDLHWSTDNNSVATVSAYGVVTPVAAGTATITVTTEDGNRTAMCLVTVAAP